MFASLIKFGQDYTYPTTVNTDYNAPTAAATAAFAGGMFVFFMVMAIAGWLIGGFLYGKIFQKAGKPFWAGFVPIYNMVVLMQIIGRNPWLLLIFLLSAIPVVGTIVVLIFWIMWLNDLSKSFGYGAGMTVLNFFLPIVGMAIIGFGEAKYKGPAALAGNKPSTPSKPAAA